MTGIDLDERFMRAAIEEAKHACEQGEVPIGAVVVRDGEIIARASNRREVDQDPSAHAEFTALCEAAQVLGRWRLSDCAVYVTLEPCCMCAGLMVNARVGRCVYGAADAKAGALGSVFNLAQTSKLNHRFDVRAGVLADDCAALLSDFFSSKRSGSVDMHLAGHASHQNARVQAAEFAALPVVDATSAHAAPRVLMAIDSFKGSANSEEIETWVAEGMRRVDPCVDIRSVALADGGEGTVDAFSRICAGERKTVRVTGAFGTPINAEWLLAYGDKPDDTWAVIEMATAAGIGQSARTDAAALAASTYGVGELLRTAVAAGAHTVYIGLGGSATNDGGAGFLQALGARLLDADGKSIDAGFAGLARLASIDLRPAFETIGDTHLVILSDVTNPLVGDHGALAVFGPQKGLDTSDSAMVDKREGWMISYGHLLDKRSSGRPSHRRRRSRRSQLTRVSGSHPCLGCRVRALRAGSERRFWRLGRRCTRAWMSCSISHSLTTPLMHVISLLPARAIWMPRRRTEKLRLVLPRVQKPPVNPLSLSWEVGHPTSMTCTVRASISCCRFVAFRCRSSKRSIPFRCMRMRFVRERLRCAPIC